MDTISAMVKPPTADHFGFLMCRTEQTLILHLRLAAQAEANALRAGDELTSQQWVSARNQNMQSIRNIMAAAGVVPSDYQLQRWLQIYKQPA